MAWHTQSAAGIHCHGGTEASPMGKRTPLQPQSQRSPGANDLVVASKQAWIILRIVRYTHTTSVQLVSRQPPTASWPGMRHAPAAALVRAAAPFTQQLCVRGARPHACLHHQGTVKARVKKCSLQNNRDCLISPCDPSPSAPSSIPIRNWQRRASRHSC